MEFPLTTNFKFSDPICLLCQGDLRNPLKTVCQHIFCQKCLLSWLNKNLICPCNCGIIFTNELIRVYDLNSNEKNLHYRCPNYYNGCGVILSHPEFSFHLRNDCKFPRNISMNTQSPLNSKDSESLLNFGKKMKEKNSEIKNNFEERILIVEKIIEKFRETQLRFIDGIEGLFGKLGNYGFFTKKEIEEFIKFKTEFTNIGEKPLKVKIATSIPNNKHVNVLKNRENKEEKIKINPNKNIENKICNNSLAKANQSGLNTEKSKSKKENMENMIQSSKNNLEIQKNKLLKITKKKSQDFLSKSKNISNAHNQRYLFPFENKSNKKQDDTSILKTFIDLSIEQNPNGINNSVNQIKKSAKLSNINNLNSKSPNLSANMSKSSISCSPVKKVSPFLILIQF